MCLEDVLEVLREHCPFVFLVLSRFKEQVVFVGFFTVFFFALNFFTSGIGFVEMFILVFYIGIF
jgi:hypothetical protein